MILRTCNPRRLTKAVHSAGGVLLICMITALSGCNTTEGVGRDVKAAGQGIEKAASEAK